MKRNKVLLLAPLFCLLILGCSNIGGGNSETDSLPSGIIRVAIGFSQTPRYAMPSDLGNPSDFVFAAALKPNGQTVAASDLVGATYRTESGASYVDVPLEAENFDRVNYVLHIFAFPQSTVIASLTNMDSAFLSGSASITIYSGERFAEISNQIALQSASFGTGSVNLTVTIPAGFQFSASCKTSGHTHSDLTCSVSGTTATISGSLSAGTHDILFSLKKGGEVVYIWQEAVCVYSGMETNSWSGGAKEIKQEQLYTTLYVSGATGRSLLSYVSDGADGTIAKPYPSVQSAIEKIQNINDSSTEYKIYVDGTVEQTTTVLNVDFSTALKLLVVGIGTSAVLKVNSSTYSANGTVAKFSGSGLDVTLKNLTITGGKSSSGGGGISVAGGNVTLKNCKVESNTVSGGQGGGIYASGGTLTLEDCSITGNTASTNGGGISNAGATIKMVGGSITGNTATINGGGIYNASGTLEISSGSIGGDTVENSAASGSGIYNTSILKISGAINFVSNNIYLPNATNQITLTGALTGSNINVYSASSQAVIIGSGYELNLSAIKKFVHTQSDKFFALQKVSNVSYGYVFSRSGNNYTADSSVLDFANYLMSIPEGDAEKTVSLSTNFTLNETVVFDNAKMKIMTDGVADRTIERGAGVEYSMFELKNGSEITLEGKSGKSIILDAKNDARGVDMTRDFSSGSTTDSIFTMKTGSVIQNGKGKHPRGLLPYGGGVELPYGKFYLDGGTITNCEAPGGYGGGVGMNGSAEFHFTSGLISNCSAKQGGGFYADGSNTIYITSADFFSGNTASYRGSKWQINGTYEGSLPVGTSQTQD